MNGDVFRRGVIFFATIFVHFKNICVVGMCEPKSQHDQLVVADHASLIFTIALALAIFEADLWPRRWPFRPERTNVIFVLELLIALLINNLLLRLFWLPVVHIGISALNCTAADLLLKASDYLFNRRKTKAVVQYAAYICSTEGVNRHALLLALCIMGRVVYVLYGQRLKCLYLALLRCACVPAGPPPESTTTKRGRARPLRTLGPPTCRSSFQDFGDERDAPDGPRGQQQQPQQSLDVGDAWRTRHGMKNRPGVEPYRRQLRLSD